jgi:cation diffusion facilitator CzcD-associated flavoprotein CzcO
MGRAEATHETLCVRSAAQPGSAQGAGEEALVEHFDVIIVGAGISGVGAACYLQKRCPGKTYAILEGRESLGGTWDLFRYPGIRSDSDMYTLGYSFRPWQGRKPIGDGASILGYVRDTAREHRVDRHIRFRHAVERASWSGRDALWTVESRRPDSGQTVSYTCRFLFLCTGYYRYDSGHAPVFPGAERFRGRIIHPQLWPADMVWAGKRVVVIGSGATAVTLIPALAEQAGHVTMLQRSPSYILSLPNRDLLAGLPDLILPAAWAAAFTRWWYALLAVAMYRMARRHPEGVKRFLRRQMRSRLGPDFDIDTHFTPAYEPWDQRLCFAPDGDFFEAIRS